MRHNRLSKQEWIQFCMIVVMFFSVGVFLVACDNPKPRKLNPTEKAWIDTHPGGELRNKPEDFAEFAILNRCDPELDTPWTWEFTKSAGGEVDSRLVNQPPVAVMNIELMKNSNTDFIFSAFKSYDVDGSIENVQWTINNEFASTEVTFRKKLLQGEVYNIGLNVWNMNQGDKAGNSYKMGSSVYFMLDVDMVTCPE